MEEIGYIRMFVDFLKQTPLLMDYINECHKANYDFDALYEKKGWHQMLPIPSSQEEIVDFGFQLLNYCLEGPRELYELGLGYTSSNNIGDIIEAFMRKSIEPFVIALRSYLEFQMIDFDDRKDDAGETNNKNGLKTIFLSYCQRDKDVADLIDEKLGVLVDQKARISRDIRDVPYRESFKDFMQSIDHHDYVLSIVSDEYLKSRNCMSEVSEIIKDNQFDKKLIFIVLSEEDRKYYKAEPNGPIGANVYTIDGQSKYISYWQKQAEKLQEQIDNLGGGYPAINQIKEKKVADKIVMDLPEFLEYIRDHKGISLSEHISNNFKDILACMNID